LFSLDAGTGIYKFGNNIYPRRIRCKSNLGHIFPGKKVRIMGWEIRYIHMCACMCACAACTDEYNDCLLYNKVQVNCVWNVHLKYYIQYCN